MLIAELKTKYQEKKCTDARVLPVRGGWLLEFKVDNKWHCVEPQRQMAEGEPRAYRSIDSCYNEIRNIGFTSIVGLQILKKR